MTDTNRAPLTEQPPQTTETARPPTTPAPSANRGFVAGLKRTGSFIIWLITGFGLLGALTRRRSARFKTEEISVYCLHRSFFLWALIVTGFVGAFATRHHGNPILWGWIYVWVVVYTMLTLLF